jgi:hypothetical protein
MIALFERIYEEEGEHLDPRIEARVRSFLETFDDSEGDALRGQVSLAILPADSGALSIEDAAGRVAITDSDE